MNVLLYKTFVLYFHLKLFYFQADLEEIYPLYHECPEEPKIVHDNKYVF